MANEITLLPGERIVTSFNKGILTLTNKRVRYESATYARSKFTSITLGSVASCGLITRSYPILLVVASVAFWGAVDQTGDARKFFIGAVIVTLIAYAVTRRGVISIASNGGAAINALARGMGREAIMEFLAAVEREKLQ